MRAAAWVALVLLLASCGSKSSGGTQVLMRFERSAGLYDAPFPSDDLVQADGTIDLSLFPNPNGILLVNQALALLQGAHGFAENGAIFFQLSGPIDETKLPDLAGSTASDASIFLLGVTPSAPDYLHRYPLQVRFTTDGGPFGSPNLLSLLPLQGVPLRAGTTYAALLTTSVLDVAGDPLAPSPAMASLVQNQAPSGMSATALAAYEGALAAVAKAGVTASDVAGLAVFTTDRPTGELGVVAADMLARPLPVIDAPFHANELFPTFCVFSTTIPLPDYQSGVPPFKSAGGTWQLDAAGKPIVQRREDANLVVTIPRSPIPAGGYPLVVFVRAGGGTNRPLVDRGPEATNGGPPIAPGTGPALYFAAAGFAGIEIDGPLEGLRNTTNGNEDFLIFNFANPGALRDNIRESAAELVLQAHLAAALSLDVASCPGAASSSGATSATFDTTRMAIMGHSMGATILPLAAAYEPLYRAIVLSGAGSSWIENVMYKKLPLDVKSFAELLIGYNAIGYSLTENDPVLSLVEWAAEPADPLSYDRSIIAEPILGAQPRHLLMEQGIVDHYILPKIANATSLSLGLDLGGTELDGTNAELAMDDQTPLSLLLPFAGGQSLALPVTANRTGAGGAKVTALVVQQPGDGIEDGHEVVFQTDPPKHQYRCFLQSFAAGGAPTVPREGAVDAPCN